MDFPEERDSTRSADLVVLNGTVLTMDGLGRRASGLAARGGRIVAVDSDRAVAEWIGPDTRVLDLGGRTAIPGFVESHNHPEFFGMTLAAQVDAGSPPNDCIADIVHRVEQAVADEEPGAWIRGYRYDDSLLADDRHPTLTDLDRVSPDNPVLLTHVSGHFCVANSAALRFAGIDATTPDPPGGRIARDSSGQPTGLLIEGAAFMVNSLVPSRGGDEAVEALRLAGAEYARHGVTTVHDAGIGLIGGRAGLDAYRTLARTGGLPTRVHGYLFHDLVAGLDEGIPEAPDPAADDDRFALSGVKIVADGSIQGLTGCLAEGYTCAPEDHGMMLLDPTTSDAGSPRWTRRAGRWPCTATGTPPSRRSSTGTSGSGSNPDTAGGTGSSTVRRCGRTNSTAWPRTTCWPRSSSNTSTTGATATGTASSVRSGHAASVRWPRRARGD